MKRICTICARGGSKGLPGKNTMPLAGKPLIAHTIEQAKEADVFDAIVFSSDSEDILESAQQWGAELIVRRPDEMAVDTASKLPAIKHAVLEAEKRMNFVCDTIIDLDVTSPLRAVDDIRGAITLMEDAGVSNVITGSPARKIPYFNLVERTPEGYVKLCKPTEPRIERRQDCPECFDMNAAVYVWRRAKFMENPTVFYPDSLLFAMPEERSYDIDTPLDFQYVEFVLSNRHTAS